MSLPIRGVLRGRPRLVDRRSLLWSIGAAACVLACAACPSKDELPALEPLGEETPTPEVKRAPVSGELRLWTDLSAEELAPALAVVRADNPELTITSTFGEGGRGGEASEIDLYLWSAPAFSRPPASRGELLPLPADLLDRVAPRFRGANDTSIALSVRARGIVAGRLMANRPLSVLDLGDGRWLGEMVRTPATDVSFVEQIAATLADHGEGKTGRFLGGLRRNTRVEGKVVADGAAAIRAVAAREASITWVDHTEFHRLLFPTFDPAMHPVTAEGVVAEARLELLLPDRAHTGVPWTATVAAIPKGARMEQAVAALAALLSTGGQEAFAWPRREYSVLDDLAGPPGAPKRADITWSEAGLAARAEWIEDAAFLADQVDLPPEPPAPPEAGPAGEAPTPEQAASATD